MEKILVTGGNGYIGSRLCNTLSKKFKITCLDNLMFNHPFPTDQNNNISYIKGDVRDSSLMKSILKDADIIIPLAALVGAPICNKYPKEAEEINFEAIKKMCENISKNQRIIMPVSNSGYGIGEKDQFCDETSPLNPISIYGKTKVRAEEEILNREMSISFRLATVFGVSQRMRTDLLVNNFTYIALFKNYLKLYEPHFRRNYIHLGDIINGFEFSIKNFETMKGEIYNLGLSNANLTKEQLCERIKMQIKDFNYEIDLEGEDEDKRDYFVSNEKIEKLGFQTEYELDMGISELINYYQSPDFKEAKNI